MTDRVPLLIDCDTGIDDALALLLACASPVAEIVGVTCVGGNVEARQVLENTRAVLALAGRGDVEVALGREAPIARPLMITPETHGPRGIGDAVLPPAPGAPSARDGVTLLIEEARLRPGELTLVTLGPATNLAAAVLREPALPALLKRVVMMVGAFRTGGNTTPRGEWNAMVDPEALSVVLAAWSPDGPTRWPDPPARPVMLGLDVTEQARLLPAHLDQLVERAGGPDAPVVRFVLDALAFYRRFHQQYDGFDGAFIHDPLALAVALEPALATTQAVTVDVELGGRLTTGETVADWRGHWGRPPNADVVVAADIPGFFDRFLDRLVALAVARR
ncbi:MAG: nucleoside hydrolase [Chloroflexota bacterium]